MRQGKYEQALPLLKKKNEILNMIRVGHVAGIKRYSWSNLKKHTVLLDLAKKRKQ